MAIGLKNIRQRKTSVEAETKDSATPTYPWTNSISENTAEAQLEINVESKENVVLSANDLPRDQKAKEAVLKARKIAEENRRMILAIHERRIGKDVRPLAIKDSWSRNDDYLFFVRNNHPSKFGLLDKFRNWIWGEKSDESGDKVSE